MAKKINDGEPVFPVLTVSGDLAIAEGGMTLRDYFIAHAPAEPQPWFFPEMKNPRTEIPSLKDMPDGVSKRDIKQFGRYHHGYPRYAAGNNASREIKDWVDRCNSANKAALAWDEEFCKQRYIQWPAAWADAMLAARKKT